MEEMIIEAVASTSRDKSKEKKAKKRKSSIANPESNNGTDNISSPNRLKGDVTLPPASDAYDQEGAQVSYLPRKDSDKAPIIHPGIEASDGNPNEDQNEKKRKKSSKKKKSNADSKCDHNEISSEKESQTREPTSDSCTTANAEVSGRAPSINPDREAADGNQNEDHNEKERKKSSKKKKSDAVSNCDSNDISLQKESQIGEPTSDTFTRAIAEVPKKEDDRAPGIYPEREAADGNQSEDQNVKKRKESRRKKKSNAGSNRDPDDISLQKESQIGEPTNDTCTGENAEVLRRESGKAPSIHPDREAADGNQNVDQNAKEKKRSSKKKKLAASCNCDPNDISLEKESRIGEPTSDTCTRENAEISRMDCDKAPSIHSDRETADVDQNVEQSAKGKKISRKKKKSEACSSSDPNYIFSQSESQIGEPTKDTCTRANAEVPRKEGDKASSIHPDREAADGNQNVDQNAKGKKRSSKKQKLEASCNCDPNDMSLEKESQIGEHTSDTCTRENAEVPRMDCDKAPSSHLDREAADGDQNVEQSAKGKKRSSKKKKWEGGSSSNTNYIFSQRESQIGEPSNDTCSRANTEVPRKEGDKASSIHPDREAADGIQNEFHDATERKRSRKKKKSEVGSNCDPNDISLEKESQIGGPTRDTCTTVITEVVNTQSVKNDKSGCAHTDTEVINGEATGHSNALKDSKSAIHDQINESKGKKRKRPRKRNKTTLPTVGDNDKAGSTHVDGKTTEITVNSLSNLVGSDNNRCGSALSNDHVNSGGGPHRKLLILDLNGLLADIRSCRVKGFIPDYSTKKRKIYKRPFVEDFLQFCFDNFDVGIWTSRRRDLMQSILNRLVGARCKRFLFCLDQSHCTETGYNITKTKPLFLKELKKVWNAEEGIPVQKGYYNESNTLLVDDSPYKVLRNPPYTAIFPKPYEVMSTKDNSLGPNGELRLYLERLAKAENVQKFVEENRIGQPPITSSDSKWSFYCQVINDLKDEEDRSHDNSTSTVSGIKVEESCKTE